MGEISWGWALRRFGVDGVGLALGARGLGVQARGLAARAARFGARGRLLALALGLGRGLLAGGSLRGCCLGLGAVALGGLLALLGGALGLEPAALLLALGLLGLELGLGLLLACLGR